MDVNFLRAFIFGNLKIPIVSCISIGCICFRTTTYAFGPDRAFGKIGLVFLANQVSSLPSVLCNFNNSDNLSGTHSEHMFKSLSHINV